jgi:3-hydroxymyristoyl/3-hydroxydecanoyl-(acyl carrier protein) dehydratase
MNGQLGAFSFVDRIVAVEPGLRARGRFTIPAGIAAFPASLVAESVGQLAAWSAMAAVAFQHRPVAGLAGLVDIFGEPRPGQTLDLSVELQRAEADVIAYGGLAEVDGRPLLRLTDCVGPMLPMPEFDDPQAVQARFSLLCEAGAAPGRFAGVPTLPLQLVATDSGKELRAHLRVPETADFFADHFPRRAVLPGTLLMDAMLRLAIRLAAHAAPGKPEARLLPSQVSDVKLRAFIPPGETLELTALLEEASDRGALLGVSARMGRKRVGGVRIALGRGASA